MRGILRIGRKLLVNDRAKFSALLVGITLGGGGTATAMKGPVVAVLLALLATTAVPAGRNPFAFFGPSVVVSADDRRRLDAGEPIAEVLPGADHEVVLFAAVPVDITGDRFAGRMQDVAGLKKGPYVPEIHRFSAPPRIGDLAELTLDDGDLSEIRGCRPGSCGLKLTGAEMRDLQGVAAVAKDWKPAVQDAFRRVVLGRVEAYLDHGLAALEEPEDHHLQPVSPAMAFAKLLTHSPFLSSGAPRFADFLGGYPGTPDHDVESFLYWSKERMADRSIISATHVAIVRGNGATMPEVLVAGKGIFATHYVNASLGLTALVGGQQGVPRYLAYLNRSNADVFGGLLGKVVRWSVERELKAAAPNILLELRRRLDSREPQPADGAPSSP